MSFVVKDGRFVARLIHVETSSPAPLGNVLAFLYQDKGAPANEWSLYYRLRYYLDDKIGPASIDRTSEYLVSFTGSFEDARQQAMEVFQAISLVGGGHPIDEAVIDSADVVAVSQIIAKQPYIHGYAVAPSGQVIQA